MYVHMYIPMLLQHNGTQHHSYVTEGYPVDNNGVNNNQWDHCEVFCIGICIISQLRMC